MNYKSLASSNELEQNTTLPPPVRHPFREACKFARQQDKVLEDLTQQRRALPGEELPNSSFANKTDGECPDGMTPDNFEQEIEGRFQEMDALTDPVELDIDTPTPHQDMPMM